MRYFVEPAGTNTGNISTSHWNTPGAVPGYLDATLSHILASSPTNGDEIWALHGTYSFGRPLVINQNPAPLSIYGGFAGWETYLCQRNANINSLQFLTDFFQNPSILDGGNRNRVIEMQQANVCLIDGFVIQNGDAGTGNGGGVYASGQNLRFENLVFMDNRAGNNGGGMYTGVRNVMIKNTIFFNNQATDGGGICVSDSSNTLLVNLLFNENQAAGNGNAIFTMGYFGVKIINNTISGNIGGSSDVYCLPTTAMSSMEIYNSIIYPDRLAAATVPPFPNVRVEHCLLGVFPAPPIAFPVPPNLPIGTVPNFVNMAPLPAGNYRLQAASPCIDAGNTNLIFPFSATDLEGEPRFIDKGMSPPLPSFIIGVIDMGAFEVQ